MTKKDRQRVFDKFGGRCAYCGCELGSRWHIDHANSLHRYSNYDKAKQKYIATGECRHPENHTEENFMPSCISCNITKSTYSIEEFREWIQQTVEALNKNHYNSYKFAKRYGLVQETVKPVVFYFETHKPE